MRRVPSVAGAAWARCSRSASGSSRKACRCAGAACSSAAAAGTARERGSDRMRLAPNPHLPGRGGARDPDKILEAERLGYSSVWTAEAYGSDAVTPAAWIAARTTRIHVGTGIMQIPARTPAMTAMTAMTLDALSGGRFRLGLGVSGPQVVEGWHGQAFGKPLTKDRKSTRLNSSHLVISYAVCCLKKKTGISWDMAVNDGPRYESVFTLSSIMVLLRRMTWDSETFDAPR